MRGDFSNIMSLLSPWFALLSLLSPLPIGTDRRMRRVPWVTYVLIAANVLVYVLAPHDPNFLATFGLTPSRPVPRTLFTYMFLHVSFWHLLWNMVFLWLFGPHVEDALGKSAFVALYFGGGVAAGLLHMAISLILLRHGVGTGAYAPLVGASGAISSILAPFAVRFHRSQLRMLWLPGLLIPGGWARLEVPAVAGLLVWLVQTVWAAVWSLVHPVSGGTANWAHLGGFAFGLVAAQLTDLLRDGRQDYRLQDARAAAGQGQSLLAGAIAHFRAFLDHDPDNAAVRVELARALAQEGGEESRQAAALEMLAAVRAWTKQDKLPEAARACAEARRLGLGLLLTPRERLRLASRAEEDDRDTDTAAWLLRAVLVQTPEAPEAEMARLRLGRLLLSADPAQARDVLTGFLARYPDSAWARQAQELLRQTNV